MLNNFIENLRSMLNNFEMKQSEKEDILSDYAQMIEDGKEKGLSDDDILNLIGSPEKIYHELEETYKKKDIIKQGEKYIALSPFISLIIFMVIGLTLDAWHPGWMSFLLIPMTAITVSMINEKEAHLLTALSPFISAIIFFAVGFTLNIWHPTWLVFFSIPVIAVINSRHDMAFLEFLAAETVFLSLCAFIIIGDITGIYHPTWLLLLLVIPIGLLTEENRREKVVLEVTFFLGTGLYLWSGYAFDEWTLSLLFFLLFLVPAVRYGKINLVVGEEETYKKEILILSVLSILAFMLVGYFFEAFTLSWLFLLVIPVGAIILHERIEGSFKLKAYTPVVVFISIALFYLVGYLFDLWIVSWLFFLLIPIVAIIEE